MPVFEGLSLSSEKTAVIFDIGRAYTKCGFAGESGPRCIVPSEVKKQDNTTVPLHLQSHSDDQQHSLLVEFLHHLYFRHLLVNPKDRRVVIVESILSSTTRFRNALARVLFRHFEVPSILIVSGHVVSLYTLGIPSALVVDCGYSETVVIPVYEGIPLLNAWQALPLASKAVHQFLDAHLKEVATVKINRNEEVPLSTVTDALDEKILEDIKVRTCFVAKLEWAKALQTQSTTSPPVLPQSVEYPLDGNKVLIIPGKTRQIACEVMFESDADETSLTTLLLDSLKKCAMDTRKTLAENIVVTGGTAMLMGFKHRLMCELNDLAQTEKYKQELGSLTFKFHTPPAKDNYTAWLGGAIFGSLDIAGSRSLNREHYMKGVPLPDWCSLDNVDDADDTRTPPK